MSEVNHACELFNALGMSNHEVDALLASVELFSAPPSPGLAYGLEVASRSGHTPEEKLSFQALALLGMEQVFQLLSAERQAVVRGLAAPAQAIRAERQQQEQQRTNQVAADEAANDQAATAHNAYIEQIMNARVCIADGPSGHCTVRDLAEAIGRHLGLPGLLDQIGLAVDAAIRNQPLGEGDG